MTGHAGTAASYFCKRKLFHYIQRFARPDHTYAFTEAFVAADRDFLNAAFQEGRFNDARAGACVVVCHVSEDGVVTAANAGDCRALVGRRTNSSAPSEWQCLPLTLDHQVENPKERERLLREHPDEPDLFGRPHDP